MSKKDDLLKTIPAARIALNEIEAAEQQEQNRNLVGRCFQYRNCYPCPQDESDYWWSYRKVTGMDDEGGLRVVSFEKDKYGEIRINPSEYHSTSGWKEITPDEFDAAWAGIKAEIQGMQP